jgi:hypothetical protein
MAVIPIPGQNTIITTGGQSVVAISNSPNGGYITNPLIATDQGISAVEPLYVDPVGSAGMLHANGTVFALQPGQTWNVIPGQTTPTYVNAASSGHKFSAVSW